MITKADIVIIMSLGVAGLSALIMLLVWEATIFLQPFWHGIVSLFAWVVGFALGCMLLWKGVTKISKKGDIKI